MKIINIITNSLFYNDLFDKQFKIFADYKPTREQLLEVRKKEVEASRNTKAISLHFQNKLIKNLSKLIHSNKKEDIQLLNYLKTRNKIIFFYSVGSSENDNYLNTSSNKHKKRVHSGIVIEFKHYDKKYYEEAIKLMKKKDDEETLNVDNIFCIKIPILVFNIRDSLFYNKKQCWVSKILTEKDSLKGNKEKLTDIDRQQKMLDFEKIKINLKNDYDSGNGVKIKLKNQMRLHALELFFCKLLVKSVDFFKRSDNIMEDITIMRFNHKC